MRERCGVLQGEVAEVRGAAKEQEVHLRAQLRQAEVTKAGLMAASCCTGGSIAH